MSTEHITHNDIMSMFRDKNVMIITAGGQIDTVIQDVAVNVDGFPLWLVCGLVEPDTIIPWSAVCAIGIKGTPVEQMPGVFPSGRTMQWPGPMEGK